MSSKPWIVLCETGWCALPPGAEPDPDACNDPTLCGHVIILRWHSKRGMPDCPECLKILEGQSHNHMTRDIKPVGVCPACDRGTRPGCSV